MVKDVLCPMVTPFDDGTVDHGSIRSLVDRLERAGVDGLVPCGTTGEFASLTPGERESVIATTADAADEARVVAGACGTAVESVRERLREAADAGADAALVVAPYYGGQATPAGNQAFYEAAVADSPLPVYLYNIPSAAGQGLEAETVVALADHDRVVGLKDSSGDLGFVDEVIRRTPGSFETLVGSDPLFVPALAMGADGGINALVQAMPETFVEAAAALDGGDFASARERQTDAIDPAVSACADRGFVPAVKALLAEQGVINSATVRSPLESLGTDARESLADSVDQTLF
ncbi:MAG: dihydrodipicolinate synthase family protein [Haloarculaceae archaeon]